MRPTTFVMTVFIGCGIPSIAACQSAVAAPLPQVAGGALGASVIETVGYWKRYCRAHVVVPQSPPVIAVVPVRPVSCGEFHYWSGSACVDARYNNPYIGPR